MFLNLNIKIAFGTARYFMIFSQIHFKTFAIENQDQTIRTEKKN